MTPPFVGETTAADFWQSRSPPARGLNRGREIAGVRRRSFKCWQRRRVIVTMGIGAGPIRLVADRPKRSKHRSRTFLISLPRSGEFRYPFGHHFGASRRRLAG